MLKFLLPVLLITLVAVPSKLLRADASETKSTYVKEYREIVSFEQLFVKGHANIYLTQGTTASMTIEAEQHIIDQIKTQMVDDELHIEINKGSHLFSIQRHKGINIYITTSELHRIDIRGAANVYGETSWNFEDLEIDLRGSGNVNLNLTAHHLVTNLQGSGDLHLKGDVVHQEVILSGSGDYNGVDLFSQIANVEVFGSGNVVLDVEDKLNISIKGAGEVKYRGEPRLTQSILGKGRVEKLQ